MSSTASVDIGPFVAGEIPAPLAYQFLSSAGMAIDLGGYTAKFSCREMSGGAPTVDGVSAVVSDPTNGVVTYTWTGTEFPTAGRYEAEVWVGNTTQRFASVLLKFEVRAAVASVPDI